MCPSLLLENWLDAGYLSRPYVPWYNFRAQWEAGLRTAYIVAKGQTQFPWELSDLRQTFLGAGPYVGGQLSWALGDTGWALFARADLGLLFGETREQTKTTYLSGPPLAGTTHHSTGHALLDVRSELGVSWTIPRQPWVRFDLGVQAEAYDWLGVVFSDAGPFLRCVIGF